MSDTPDRPDDQSESSTATLAYTAYLVHRLRKLRVLRYLIAAVAGAIVDFSVFAALYYLADVYLLLAGLGSFLVSTLVNYLVSVRIVFRAGSRFPRALELLMIYAVSATGLVWHLAILYVSVERLGMHAMLAKFLATGIVFFWNYLVRRNFVFTARH
jgi:putative flippase GtrA